jgi:RNA polymerase sigma-70 factor (ECF subfamily)
MLLHDARRDARFAGGELVLLADQDRGLWHESQIEEGRQLLDRALALHGRGSYVVQAAIAALHTDDDPDQAEIAALYAELARLTRSPVVEVNRAVAVAEAEGPEAGLELLERIELDGYRYFHAARAELLRRAGRIGDAREAYERALRLTDDGPEQRHLVRRMAELGDT